MYDPGEGGHIIPYFTHFGKSIIFLGGNLKKSVWMYIISLDSWISLPDAPRPIQFAGIQVST